MSALPVDAPARAPVTGIPTTRILVGDVRRGLGLLADQSVHCIVTSPPYYGLRDYGLPPSVWGGDAACVHEWGVTHRGAWANSVPGPGAGGKNAPSRNHTKEAGAFCAKCGAWRGCLGLEPTPAAFIANLVTVFRECWRVLRDDGSLFLNIDDSYAGSGRGPTGVNGVGQHEQRQGFDSPAPFRGIKAKSLMLIPERLLIALSDDGWIVRDKIVWHKTAPMPESVRDRCTDAWEPVFHLVKRGRYFGDMEAVKEPAAESVKARATANLRNVWSLSPEPFAEAHFATFPTELPRRCIKIGTSERGVCPACGKPWGRVTSKTLVLQPDVSAERNAFRGKGEEAEDTTGNVAQANRTGTPRGTNHTVTLGWQPSCQCDAGDPVPATVLDPFGGVMTTALVANQLGRDSISIELGPKYAAMGARRIQDDAGMLCDITIEEMP